MATQQLTTARLKAISDKDVGSILNDGGGFRGRVRRDRRGKLTVQFEYKYRTGKNYRTAKVVQWPKHSLAEIRGMCREMKAALSKGIDPIGARKAEKLQTEFEQAQQIEKQKQEICALLLRRLPAALSPTLSPRGKSWSYPAARMAGRKQCGL